MNLPNLLTLLRIFFVPLLVAALLADHHPTLQAWLPDHPELLALAIFLTAAATDLLDGYFARRWSQITTVGTLLDPIADKLLVSAALVSLVDTHRAKAWMVILIISREFAVSGLRSIAAASGYTIKASELGKTKMASQVAAIALVIASVRWPVFAQFADIAMWAVVVFGIASALQYFWKFWNKVDVQVKRRRRRELLILENERARQRRAARVAAKGTVVTAVLLALAATPVRAQFLEFKDPKAPRMRDGNVNLTAPVARQADGHPDLSGIWSTDAGYFRDIAKDLKPGEVDMLPAAKAIQQQRETSDHIGDPMAECMPPGVPRMDTSNSETALHPFKIVQTPSLVVMLYETSSNSTFRQVFLDGRPLPRDPQPTWLGYSVGKWEGSTLVVTTTGFNGREWIDTYKGHPQSDAAVVTERFTRRDFGHMELEITINDPKNYTKPWTVKLPMILLPDTDLIETFCENDTARKHGSVR